MANYFDQFDAQPAPVAKKAAVTGAGNFFDQFDASKPKAAMPGRGRTMFDQAMQGATFGFADEVQDRLGAGIASLLTDESYSDLLNEARAASQQRLEQQREERPALSMASNLAGGILTGGAGLTTKTGAAVASSLRTGNLAARAAKAGLAGAASGGLYGFGDAVGEERTASAGRGALLGAALGAAVPYAGAGLRKLNTRTIVPAADEIRQAASALYKKADAAAGTLKPEFTDSFVDAVERMRPQTDIGRAVGGDSVFTQLSERLSGIRGKPMTLQAAQEVDELLGDAIDGLVRDGKLTKEGKRLYDVQSSFRNMIENADDSMMSGGRAGFDALKEGRKMWGVSRRMNDIERIIANADTYQVPATAIKTGFRALLKNPNRLRGYSPQEVRAIEKAASTGIATDVLGVFGSRLGPIAAGAGGFASMGPVGGAAAALGSYATSTASRNAATALQRGRANQALRAVAERSGMVRQEPRLDVPAITEQLMQRITGRSAAIPSEAAPLLALPAPGAARPMTEAQIRAAQRILNEAPPAGKSGTFRYDYGDVPYNVQYMPGETLRYLPAPGRDIAADAAGNARAMTAAEQESAIALRQRAAELGISPDVLRAAIAQESRKIMPMRGQSELGRTVAENPTVTLQQIMKMSPAQARRFLQQKPLRTPKK